jgi:hypothetical protein
MSEAVSAARASDLEASAATSEEGRRTVHRFIFGDEKAAESKTFKFANMDIKGTNGATFVTLSNISVTLYRAPHASGGYDAYVTLDYSYSSDGWYTNAAWINPAGGLAAMVILKDSQGGGLLSSDAGKISVSCGDHGVETLFQKAIDPDLYDLTAEVSIQLPGGFTWRKC